jgi:hypothetical protein
MSKKGTKAAEVETNAMVVAPVTDVVASDSALAELGLAEFTTEVETDDYPIMAFGGNENKGEENTIYAGQSIVGEFVGTVPMWSTEPKENWKEEEAEGRKYWTSLHYKFVNPKTGKHFGIFSTSTLFNLQKIVTSATDPSVKNPLIGIRYLGKIEGKDVLEKEHGIILTKGSSAHVCKLLTPKGMTIDTYFSGCLNYTRNPLPNFGTKVKLSKIEQAKKNFAMIEARKEAHLATQLQGQLAQH